MVLRRGSKLRFVYQLERFLKKIFMKTSFLLSTDNFHQHGYLLALDFSKAFDTISADMSVKMLNKFGWPPAMTRLLGLVWGTQHRFIQWENHIHNVPLLAAVSNPKGIPQVRLFALFGWKFLCAKVLSPCRFISMTVRVPRPFLSILVLLELLCGFEGKLAKS